MKIKMQRENDTLDLSTDYEVFACIDETGVIPAGFYMDSNWWKDMGSPDEIEIEIIQ